MNKIFIAVSSDELLNEAVDQHSELNEIKSFIANLKQRMFKMKFPTLNSVPAKIRNEAKNFSKIKFLQTFSTYRKDVEGISKYFSKHTRNEPLRMALAAGIVMKANATGSDLKNETRLMEQKYDNMEKRIKQPSVVICILLISLISGLLVKAYTLSQSSAISTSAGYQDLTVKNFFKAGKVPITYIFAVLIALVSGVYYFSDTDTVGYVGSEDSVPRNPTVYASSKQTDHFSL